MRASGRPVRGERSADVQDMNRKFSTYLFKINCRRTRERLILSEVHRNTQIYTIRKSTEIKTNKQKDIYGGVTDTVLFVYEPSSLIIAS